MTLIFLVFIILLFIGDIAVLIKGIADWRKKIEDKEGLQRNIWLGAFYILTAVLIILILYVYYEGLFK
jgi:H+/Cl- antiporter ClcA